MRVPPRILLVSVAVAIGIACGTATKLTAVWKAPEAAGTRFKKIIVAAQTKDQASRRSLESHLVSRIANSTASYEVPDRGGDARRQPREGQDLGRRPSTAR